MKLSVPARSDIASLFSFARYSWLGSVKSRAFLSLDTIILGVFVVNDLIGVYEIAWNLASFFAIFGISISKTLFPEISSLDDPERIRSLTSASLAYGGLFLIPGLVGSILLGDVVLSIYGNEFTKGYYVLVVLVIARLVYVYQSQLLTTVQAMDRPDVAFRVNGVFLVANLLFNVVLVAEFGWLGAAIGTTLSAVISFVHSYVATRRLISFEFPTREVMLQVVSAAAMSVVVIVSRRTYGESLLVVIPTILLGGALYFATLWAISSQFRLTVRNNIPESVQHYLGSR